MGESAAQRLLLELPASGEPAGLRAWSVAFVSRDIPRTAAEPVAGGGGGGGGRPPRPPPPPGGHRGGVGGGPAPPPHPPRAQLCGTPLDRIAVSVARIERGDGWAANAALPQIVIALKRSAGCVATPIKNAAVVWTPTSWDDNDFILQVNNCLTVAFEIWAYIIDAAGPLKLAFEVVVDRIGGTTSVDYGPTVQAAP
jgi:hypothetical protein